MSSLGGCSNLDRSLLFFTTSTAGLEVGIDATQSSGKILIGYKRAEGVVNPVYIPPQRTTEHQRDPWTGKIAKTTIVESGGEADKVYRKQAYSVMAKLTGEANGRGGIGKDNEFEAAGAIAQWFATGRAADLLAQNEFAAAALTGSLGTAKAIASTEVLGSKLTQDSFDPNVIATLGTVIDDLGANGTAEARKAVDRLNREIAPLLKQFGTVQYYEQTVVTSQLVVAHSGRWVYTPGTKPAFRQWLELQGLLGNGVKSIENVLTHPETSFNTIGTKIYSIKPGTTKVVIDPTIRQNVVDAIAKEKKVHASHTKAISQDEIVVEAIKEVMGIWIKLYTGGEK